MLSNKTLTQKGTIFFDKWKVLSNANTYNYIYYFAQKLANLSSLALISPNPPPPPPQLLMKMSKYIKRRLAKSSHFSRANVAIFALDHCKNILLLT